MKLHHPILLTQTITMGVGIFEDTREFRPVVWTKQIEDKIVEGKIVHKDRDLYKGNIISNYEFYTNCWGRKQRVAYVTGVRPFFNAKNENRCIY